MNCCNRTARSTPRTQMMDSVVTKRMRFEKCPATTRARMCCPGKASFLSAHEHDKHMVCTSGASESLVALVGRRCYWTQGLALVIKQWLNGPEWSTWAHLSS